MAPEELARQLETLDEGTISSLPESLRVRLYTATRNAHLALETSTEAIARLLLTQPSEGIYVRVAADIRLFKALGQNALTISEIAEATGAQPKLLDYLLRGLTAFGVTKQIDSRKFAASSKYAIFQNENFEGAFPGCQDFMAKTVGNWPEFLASTQYRCPQDPNDTAVQYAFGTKGMSFWKTFESNPERANLIRNMSVLMSAWADGFTQLEDMYPVQERLENGFDPKTAMFVDVGGNLGQKALALKETFPKLPGRFVVEDLPQVIDHAPKDDSLYKDIEFVAHDFFTEQPIKGARCYYLRQTLHNWHDSDVIKILGQLRDAAQPGYSRLLLHEIVVTEKNTKPWVACQDLNMLSMFALGERTEADWRALCEKSGLKVNRIYTTDNPASEGIIEIEV